MRCFDCIAAERSTLKASSSATSRTRIRMPLARSTSLRSVKRSRTSLSSSRSDWSRLNRAWATWITDRSRAGAYPFTT